MRVQPIDPPLAVDGDVGGRTVLPVGGRGEDTALPPQARREAGEPRLHEGGSRGEAGDEEAEQGEEEGRGRVQGQVGQSDAGGGDDDGVDGIGGVGGVIRLPEGEGADRDVVRREERDGDDERRQHERYRAGLVSPPKLVWNVPLVLPILEARDSGLLRC